MNGGLYGDVGASQCSRSIDLLKVNHEGGYPLWDVPVMVNGRSLYPSITSDGEVELSTCQESGQNMDMRSGSGFCSEIESLADIRGLFNLGELNRLHIYNVRRLEIPPDLPYERLSNLHTVVLEKSYLSCLGDINPLARLPNLRRIVLKSNTIGGYNRLKGLNPSRPV